MERRTQELLAQAEGRAPSRGGTADSENDDIFGFGAKAISEDTLREMRRQVREAVQAEWGAGCEVQAPRNSNGCTHAHAHRMKPTWPAQWQRFAGARRPAVAGSFPRYTAPTARLALRLRCGGRRGESSHLVDFHDRRHPARYGRRRSGSCHKGLESEGRRRRSASRSTARQRRSRRRRPSPMQNLRLTHRRQTAGKKRTATSTSQCIKNPACSSACWIGRRSVAYAMSTARRS